MRAIKIVLIASFLISIGFAQNCGDASFKLKYTTCSINLTVTIDFSKAMVNSENIKYEVDFILRNFTTSLPFNDSNFNIALLSFGTINGSQIFGPFRSYSDFCDVVQKQWEVSRQFGLYDADLNETIWTYWNYISMQQDLDNVICSEETYCTNKLVLFSAINDNATVESAFKIADKINNHSFTIFVGINVTNVHPYFNIGRRLFFNILFNDYNINVGLPLATYLQDVLCRMNVQATEQHKCGNAYCENILCGPHEDVVRCQYFAGCIFDQCYYWRHSAKTWLIAKSYCDTINTSLLTIYNESFQEEIYKLMGEYNYWTGLFSYLHVDPIWTWSNSNITLSETNYTNWGIGQPDIKDGYNLCVSDTNSTNLIQGWTPLNCETEHKFFMCYKAPSLPEMSERKNKQIIKILGISIGSLLFILAIFIIGVKSYQSFKLHRARMRDRLVTNLSNSTNSTYQEQVIDPSATPDLGCARQQEATIIENDSELPLITSLLQQASGTILSRSTSMNLNMELRQPDRATFGRIINSMIPNANRLIFPHDTRAYEFNYGEIENLKLLEATPRNIIKKAVHKPTKNPIVIKYITIPYSHFFADNDENYQHYLKMLREIENFRQLWEHPNIVNFYGLCIHGEHALIVMEQMDLSLRQLYLVIHMRGEKFSEKVIGCIFAQIVDALLHCNSKNIIHRDVKPENILINYSGEVKLCDFGESRILEDSTASTSAGTNLYWPPERFCGGTYDIKTEVWSLGITLFEIILGKLPYNSETNNMIDLHKNIANANFEEIIDKEIKPVYSEVLCDQLRLCTQRVESRPDLETLKSSGFYREYSNLNDEEVSNFFASFQGSGKG